jgi:hypothetical protein
MNAFLIAFAAFFCVGLAAPGSMRFHGWLPPDLDELGSALERIFPSDRHR